MRIFLDMDGVLSDFEGMYAKLYGADSYTILYQDRDKFKAEGSTTEDAIAEAEQLFIKRIKQDTNYWLNIEPYPWAKELFHMCHAQSTTYILTAIMAEDMDRAIQHKLVWAPNRLEGDPKILFTASARDPQTKRHTGNKSMWCKCPYDILIDDSESNIREWPGVSYKFDPARAAQNKNEVLSEILQLITTTIDREKTNA